MLVATLYEPHQALGDACRSHDGMLGVAIAWLLSSRGLRFEAGTYARDLELDFRFKVGDRSVLLEAKMHRPPGDAAGTQRTLTQDVAQAASHAEAIKSSGSSLSDVWIVTNYDHQAIEAELQRVLKRQRERMETHGIRFVEAGALPSMLTGERRRQATSS